MTLAVERGEGPSTHLKSTWGGRSGAEGLRPSVERTRVGLERLLSRYSPETIKFLIEQVERAKAEVGEDPQSLADFFQEQGTILIDTGRKSGELGLTLAQLAKSIRLSQKKPGTSIN